MILIVLTVAVIALMIAVLAIFLLMIGRLLNRTANNLDDGLKSMGTILGHAGAIRPGIARINKTGGELVGAVPLLIDDVDQLIAKTAPAAPASASAAPAAQGSSTATRSPAVTAADPAIATSEAAPVGVGYMDE